MITADELMKCNEIPLDQQILQAVAEHEPIKRYQIADHCQTSRDRVAVLGRISEMRKASLLDIGDAQDGYIVMLTPEGRAALSEFEEAPAAEPESENAGAAPESGNGKKSGLKRVVDFLILHPGATRDQVKKAFYDELKPLSVALCEGRRNGRITMTKNGDIETFHPGPNALVKLAPNRKPPNEKPVGNHSPVVLSTDGDRLDTKPADRNSEAIPATLALSPAGESAAIEEAYRNGEIQVLPTMESSQKPADEAGSEPRFRIARTSDKTFILWGLSPEPIELNPADSATLVDFIVDWG